MSKHGWRLSALALALIATTCARSGSDDCARKVQELQRALVAFDDAATLLDGRYREINLPVAVAPASGSLAPGGLIALREGRLFLDGRDLGKAETTEAVANLEQDLATLARLWNQLHPGGTEPRVYVFADGRTKVASMRPLLLIAARRFAVRLAISPSNAPAIPATPQGAIDFKRKWDTAAEPGDYARLLAEELATRAFSCSSLDDNLRALTKSPYEGRAQRLIRGATQGLRDCQCKVDDFEGLSYVLAFGLSADKARRRSIPLQLDARADGTLGLAANATVQDLAKALTTIDGSSKDTGPVSPR